MSGAVAAVPYVTEWSGEPKWNDTLVKGLCANGNELSDYSNYKVVMDSTFAAHGHRT